MPRVSEAGLLLKLHMGARSVPTATWADDDDLCAAKGFSLSFSFFSL